MHQTETCQNHPYNLQLRVLAADEKLDAILSKFLHYEAQLAQILTLSNWMSRMESHLANTLGGFAARLTEMEQNFSAFTARMCKVETGVTSASIVSGCPSGSRPLPGQKDSSTATASCDHGSSDRASKDTWSNRSARENPLQNKNYISSTRVRNKNQMSRFVVRFKDDGIPQSVNSHFCNNHEHDSCSSIQVTRIPRDRSTFFVGLANLGYKVSLPKYSKFLIAGVESDCQFSSLHRSFLLVCLYLIFPTIFCNKSLLKQVLRPRIAPSPPRSFVAWRVEVFFLRLRHFVATEGSHSLLHTSNPEAHVPHKREINQIQCKRPYDTAIATFTPPFGEERGQFILTQVEPTIEPDAVCNRVSPLSLTTFCPSEPGFLGWPLTQTGGQMQAAAPLREDADGNLSGSVLLGHLHQRWRRDASQPPKVLQRQQVRDTCVDIPVGGFRCVEGFSGFSSLQGTEAKSTSNG